MPIAEGNSQLPVVLSEEMRDYVREEAKRRLVPEAQVVRWAIDAYMKANPHE